MSKNQLHFNPDTGKVGKCRAEQGGYPFIDNSDPNGGHYGTQEEMDAYLERRAELETASSGNNGLEEKGTHETKETPKQRRPQRLIKSLNSQVLVTTRELSVKGIA